jgi:hypothetical protein
MIFAGFVTSNTFKAEKAVSRPISLFVNTAAKIISAYGAGPYYARTVTAPLVA